MIFKSAQIDKFLKKNDPAVKCVVVYGSNEGLVAEYVKRLTLSVCPDLNDPFCVANLNMADINADSGLLYSEYASRSLMGGRRVVVVKDADNNLTKHLKTMFDTVSSDTLVVISSTAFNKKSSMVVLAEGREDMAVIACYEDRDEDIFSTAKTMFSEQKMLIGNEALQLLCSRLSNDRKTNIGEIEKLITYKGDDKNITVDDVRCVIADQSSSNTDDVCYFAANGYSDKAMEAYRKLMNEGEEPISVLRAMWYHFSKILTCLASMENGDTPEKAMQKLFPKIIFFREAAFKRQLMLWTKDKVLSVVELLYKCERDCKTTNMPTFELVSYMLLQISSAAAKAARGR